MSFQALKKAEEEASAMVDAARKERSERMKLAKVEAKKEIESFKAHQMARLDKLREESEKQGEEVSKMSETTDGIIKQLNKDLEANGAKAVDLLMKAVVNIEVNVPVARKGLSTSR